MRQQRRCSARFLWTLEVSFWNSAPSRTTPTLEAQQSAQTLQAPSSRKSRVERRLAAAGRGLPVDSRSICGTLRASQQVLGEYTGTASACSAAMVRTQDYAQLHHRSIIMLLTTSRSRSERPIDHRFGRHLRLHGLE